MKLIRLGAAYLNMDLVTDVWVDRDRVTVFFAVPAMHSADPFHGVTSAMSTREVSFHGPQAAALVQWLEKRAKDITPDLDEGEPADIRGDEATTLIGGDTFDDGPSA
jgi:hypothetical protein